MKMLVALIKPFKLEDVKQALFEIGCSGLTVTEVRGVGRQKGHTELYRGPSTKVDFLPKMKIELALPDETLERALEVVSAAAHTGNIGDGKIFVLPLEHCVRIRTGETDKDAL